MQSLMNSLLSKCLLAACCICLQAGEPEPFRQIAEPYLKAYCVDCHGPEKAKAKFRVDGIDGQITNGKDVVRWEKILEMVSIGDMPPEDEPQAPKQETKHFEAWITGELAKIGRGQDPGKLALPHQANRVDHDELFSGEHKGPAWSPARLWRKSPYNYKWFTLPYVELAQPLQGLGGKDFQDYASLLAEEAAVNAMLGNSRLFATAMVAQKRTHLNRFLNVFFGEKPIEPTEETVDRAIVELFMAIFQRQPTTEDRARYVDGLFAKNRELGGLKTGFETLIVAMLMSPEFVFRAEMGLGEELPDGRRRLNSQEIAYALSFAFYDVPDRDLLKAAAEDRLQTRDDVRREIRRILAIENPSKGYWGYASPHVLSKDYYALRPRVLRFFQEFFGYVAAPDVFKDADRNPGHDADRLRKDADLFVLNVLEKDENVLAELLTSNVYPICNLWPNTTKGFDSQHVAAAYMPPERAAENLRGPKDPSEGMASFPFLVTFPKTERAGMLTHPAWLVANSGNFETDPVHRGLWIRKHLLGDMVPDVPIGVDARVPEDPERTFRERLDAATGKEECMRCHKGMNPLGLAFEAYDDFGRYREQIVLGDADAYFKAMRRYKGGLQNLEKHVKEWEGMDAAGRAAKVKWAEDALAKAKLQKPHPEAPNYEQQLAAIKSNVERWTKERERWLAVDDAEQERMIAHFRKDLAELRKNEPTARMVPVNDDGELRGTGDPALDGPVTDAIDLAHRLAKSERVRQVFVRHAFRYWMGRNETLDDSPTLMAADKAYVENGGSINAMLEALLASDSFLTRK